MTDAVQIIAIVVSAGLLALVLDLVRRRRLTEEYSFIWIVFALGMLIVSLWRESLHAVARWLDVHYPPTVLLVALIFFVFVASLYFSVVVSRHREQIERLTEALALLEAQHRRRASHDGAASLTASGNGSASSAGPDSAAVPAPRSGPATDQG